MPGLIQARAFSKTESAIKFFSQLFKQFFRNFSNNQEIINVFEVNSTTTFMWVSSIFLLIWPQSKPICSSSELFNCIGQTTFQILLQSIREHRHNTFTKPVLIYRKKNKQSNTVHTHSVSVNVFKVKYYLFLTILQWYLHWSRRHREWPYEDIRCVDCEQNNRIE